MKKLIPAVVLFFLSPAIAELLSGSAPPLEFFKLPGFAIIVILYGSGAILCRELIIRWSKGWLSLFILGAAYAIVEEGLMVKSLFDPGWVDIGLLGAYGRWGGVNWVWSLELVFFHAIISIAIPILLVELIFPRYRQKSWVGKWWLIALGVLLVADVAFGYFFLTAYRPSAFAFIMALAVVVALALVAERLPRQPFAPKPLMARNPVWYWLVGFLGTIAFFMIFGGLPSTGLHPLLTMLVWLIFMGLVGFVVMWMSGNGAGWGDRHRFALATGPLSLLILFTPIQDFYADRADNPAGMSLVGLGGLLFILWLWWWVRRREK